MGSLRFYLFPPLEFLCLFQQQMWQLCDFRESFNAGTAPFDQFPDSRLPKNEHPRALLAYLAIISKIRS